MGFDVFISHANGDKFIADIVCEKLEQNSIRCWIAHRDILPGTDYGYSIIEAINNCKIMILVFTQKSNNSKYVLKEIERAVNKNKNIITVKFEDIEPTGSIEFFISSEHWLHAVGRRLIYIQK